MSYSETAWERFFANAAREVLVPGTRVLDVGAGLRIDASRGNIEDPARAWIKPLVQEVRYEVLDPVPTYHPDVVGDVMALPMEDACYDAVICLAVLEHVPRPWKAVEEMCRVLKPGGKLFCYVPFLSPYHAMEGYYGDYFRFTEDGIRALCEGFSRVEAQAVRGPVETLTHLLPGKLGASWVRRLGRRVDGIRKASGKQVSGYFFVATK
jgi:SAM-dependent methyltransferase